MKYWPQVHTEHCSTASLAQSFLAPRGATRAPAVGDLQWAFHLPEIWGKEQRTGVLPLKRGEV